ncbi:MAG: hypothetical protein ILP19_07705, partial [Oscillospiraceae bacterium]|nr:hypothetical protein [Oscillospiraceae bacterium]
QKAALNLYTDYDGMGSSFGNELLDTKSDDRMSSVYAGTDNGDISTIRLIVTNQDVLSHKTMDISISGEYEYRVESAYRIDNSTADIIEADTSVFTHTGSGITFDAAPMSAYMIVLGGEMPEESLSDDTTAVTGDVSDTGTTKKQETTASETVSSQSETDIEPVEATEEAPVTEAPQTPEESESVTSVHTTPADEDETTVSEPQTPSQPEASVPLPVKVLGAVLTATVLLGVLYVVVFDRH